MMADADPRQPSRFPGPGPGFPSTRLRRPRRFAWSRALARQTTLNVDDLILPLFVHDADDGDQPVPSMPGVVRHTLDSLVRTAEEAAGLGIPALALFPAIDPALKTGSAREADNPENLVCRAIRAVKTELGDAVGVIADVALDPFTDHGHDGLVALHRGRAVIDNDATVRRLCDQALVQARAGCDIVAPSEMMDGRVAAIRSALDSQGFEEVMILSYAAKYASAFYGPFRDAVGSKRACIGGASASVPAAAATITPPRGKQTYQMDPANSDEALREVALDLAEGADWVMVKPGLIYLDVIQRVKERFAVPTFAYQVSGEYAMLVAAADAGWLERRDAVLESLTAFKRAGADGVLSYFAMEAARWLRET